MWVIFKHPEVRTQGTWRKNSDIFNLNFEDFFNPRFKGAFVGGFLGPSSTIPPCAGRPIANGESLLKSYVKNGRCEREREFFRA